MSNHKEYYCQSQELQGKWGGIGAERLGLQGLVTPDAFAALCENLHPLSRERLTLRNRANRTVGYDLTFDVPKSVSIVHALTRDERILDVFRSALNETMLDIEADAQTRVRVAGQDSNRVTSNLVWAKFVHFTTRPVNGIPDPHLHAHCFAFNATWDPVEERWKAGQFRDIKRDAPGYQAAFHSRLAAGLKAIGYRLRVDGANFEIEGVPETLIDKFSRRKKLIEKRAFELGIKDERAKAKLGSMTREPKRHDLTETEMLNQWRGRFSEEERVAMDVPLWSRVQPVELKPGASQKALEYAIRRSFERESVVSEARILERAIAYRLEEADVKEIRQLIRTSSELVRRQIGDTWMVTTREVLAEEQAVVEWARRGHGTRQPLALGHVIRNTLLSDEQRAAVHHVLNSTDRFTGVIGKAGTDKTTMMREAIDAMETAGHSVVVVAPTADTGRGTLRKSGFADANTVEHLLTKLADHLAARGSVWWMDEAGLLSMGDMRRLIDLAEKQDARIIVSGDTGQHRSVRRGDALRILQRYADLKMATLSQIYRQSGAYKEAVGALAESNLDEAFGRLEAMGAILELPIDDAHQFVARQYATAVVLGEDLPLIVCPTHREGRLVTERLREQLKTVEKLEDERSYPILRKLDLWDADKADRRIYKPGWVLDVFKTAQGFRRGYQYEVVAVNDDGVYVRHYTGATRFLDVEQWSKHFHVYERGELRIAPGDRIRLTANGESAIDKQPLTNGTLHTVAGFTATGGIELEDGLVVPSGFAHLDHGYVTTSYVAQSKTVSRVILMESSLSFPAASSEQFYVSVSRGQGNPMIVTDDKAKLRERVRRRSQREAGLELELKADSAQQTRSEAIPLLTSRLGEHSRGDARMLDAVLEEHLIDAPKMRP